MSHGSTVITTLSPLGDDAVAVAAADGAVTIWDIVAGTRLRTLADGAGSTLRALTVTDRQRLLAAGGDDGMGYCWNPRTGAPLPPYSFGAPVSLITAVPDSDRVVVATATSVSLWDPMAVPETVLALPDEAGRVVAVLAPHGSPLVVICSAGWTGLFDPVSGEALDHAAGKGPVTCAALSDSGRYLAVGCLDGTVTIRDLSDLHRRLREQEPFGTRISALGAGSGSRGVPLIVGGDREGSVAAWNAANGRQAWRRPAAQARSAPLRGSAHRGEVTAVAVAGPAGYALTGGRDGLANVWDLRTGERRHHFPCGGPVTALTFSRDSQYAAAGTSQGELRRRAGVDC